MAEKVAPHAYLADFTPAEFQAAADVVLQLRDGARLPAHSQLLASTSPVLCNMLTVAASQVQAGNKTVLHLDDFSEQEAVNILKARTCHVRSRRQQNRHTCSCPLFGRCIAQSTA